MRALLAIVLFAGPAAAQPVEAVHVVEKRPFTEAGRWELSLYGAAQVNPQFTEHAGLSAELAWHLRESFALQLGGWWFPLARQTSLAENLLSQTAEAPTTGEAFLLQAAAMAGVELMPVYGKLDVFDGRILRLGVYLNAGLGVAKTRLQLRPSSDPITGRSFGDTGLRPLGALGVGVRAFVTERFTVRIELRDLVYSGYTSKVNGCNLADVEKIEDAATAHAAPSGLSGGCDAGAFGGTPGATAANAAGARDLLSSPAAEIINNLAFQGGVSWLF